MMLGLLLAALDQTIVATAGPDIQRDLHIEPGLYTWITTSYLVASTVLVPIWGKLSDSFGRRRVVLAGISVFLLGSVLSGVAQSAGQLILFRAVQGLGSASLFTSAFAVIADLYPPQERGKVQGAFGAVFGLSSVVGPLVGGFITDHFGWHWCFFVNIPLGGIAIAVILAKMPPLARQLDVKPRIDVVGAFLLAVGVVPLLLALSLGKVEVRAGETGWVWGSWQILTMFALAVVGIIAFLVVESRVRDPIVDLKLFRTRAFALGNFATFAAGMTFLGAIVFLPLFMVNVVGATATYAGLTTVPLTFGIIAGNIFAGNMVSKTGKAKPFLVGSIFIAGVMFAVLAFTLGPDTTKLEASWKMFFVGVGLGPSIPLYNLVIQSAVPPQAIGSATSVATFSRQIGATMGLALLGTVFATTLSSQMAIEMAKATEGVPPEMLAAPAPAEGADSEGARRAAFDKVAVEARIHDAFTEQRDLVTRALKDNDPAARAQLRNDPRTDPRMKALLGDDDPIGAAFAATTARVDDAFAKGHDAVVALSRDASMPPALATGLGQIPAAAFADETARAALLTRVHAQIDAARDETKARASAGALEGALAGMKQGEETALATVSKIERAIKNAFAFSIARVFLVSLLLAVIAFLAALVLPAIQLRTGAQTGPPSE